LSRLTATPDWSSISNNLCNVRDLHLVVGNTVVESPSPLRCRFHEAAALGPIWNEYFRQGFRWVVAPKPKLSGDVFVQIYRDEQERELSPESALYRRLTGGPCEKRYRLTEAEILFEAANTVRMGRDLLYLVSSYGNWLGAHWLQSILGDEYRVHTTDKIGRSGHIDATLLCLKPGVVMLNSACVSPGTCPEIFRKWEQIYFGDLAPIPDEELAFQRDVRDPLEQQLAELGFESSLSHFAPPVGMNIFSFDPSTVIVDQRQAALIRLLESRRFTVIPVRMRHMYTQSGGPHCATLDTVRDGELQSYFD